MKPLELKWYPCEYDEHGEPRFYEPGSFPLPDNPLNPAHCRIVINSILMGSANWREWMRETRFKDSELAAEYHQQAAYTEYWMGRTTATHTATNQDRAETLRRFATLPHAGGEQ